MANAKDNKDAAQTPANTESQAQMGSAEPDYKAENDPAKAENRDEIQFFDTTIAKLVERENEDGKKEWVEVMSDNLAPGEKLAREVAAEKADEKKAARKAADRERKTEK